MESFKSQNTMCINSCYHYWCEKCNEKINNNNKECPFCRENLDPNLFFDSKGEFGYFTKNSHCMKLIDIIKNDIKKTDLADEFNKEFDIDFLSEQEIYLMEQID